MLMILCEIILKTLKLKIFKNWDLLMWNLCITDRELWLVFCCKVSGVYSLTERQRCCCWSNFSRYLPILTAILSLLPANYRWTEACSGRGEKEPNSKAALLLLLQSQQVSASSHCYPLSLSYLLTADGLRHALVEGRRSLTARQRCCCCCNLSRYLPALTAILSLSPTC